MHRDWVSGQQPLWELGSGELLCSLLGPAQPPTLLTWDLLLHTDAAVLSEAFSADTAVATFRVFTLLVLSWTHHCLTLIHIWWWG